MLFSYKSTKYFSVLILALQSHQNNNSLSIKNTEFDPADEKNTTHTNLFSFINILIFFYNILMPIPIYNYKNCFFYQFK